MPLLLLIIGVLLLVSAIRGTENDLFSLLESDIPAYGKWAGAIVGIGLLGYIPDMKTPSRLLLAIIVFVILVKNHGIFQKLQQAFTNPPTPTPAPSVSPTNLGSLPISFQQGGTALTAAGGAAGMGGIQ